MPENQVDLRKVGDTTLIGVKHTADLTKGEGSPEALRALASADHLLMEGTSTTARIMPNYERFAQGSFVRTGRGHKVHYLEEGQDLAALAERHGLDPQIVFANQTWRAAVQMSGDPDALRDNVRKLAANAGQLFPGMSQTERIDRVIDVVQGVISTETDGRGDAADAGSLAVTRYMGSVRDVDVLGPRARALVETLPGDKTLIAGGNHLPVIERALTGRHVDNVPPWPAYVASLDPATRKSVRTFEESTRVRPRDRRTSI